MMKVKQTDLGIIKINYILVYNAIQINTSTNQWFSIII